KIVLINPQEGRKKKEWSKKAYEETQKGANVIALITSRKETKYWNDY
ncbi:adenine methyltransferase, partial [Staphylococcus felis]